MNVDPMYQYSLKFFRMIYEKALENSKEKPPFKTKQAKKISTLMNSLNCSTITFVDLFSKRISCYFHS